MRLQVYLTSWITFIPEHRLYYPFLFCLAMKLLRDLQHAHFGKYYLIFCDVQGASEIQTRHRSPRPGPSLCRKGLNKRRKDNVRLS